MIRTSCPHLLKGRFRHCGFTLIEVIVAMVIFALVMASLFVSFRTGIKAYDIGATHSEAGQAARFAVTQVADDLRNVFYKRENTYNVTRRQREALLMQMQQQQLKSGSKTPDVQDPNLPELGPKIDLSFHGSDGDLSFVRNQTFKRREDRKIWGLARTHYYVSNGNLYRALDDIKAPETDEDGNEVPKATVPQVDKIASNVKGFSVKFGYYFDGEWLTAPNWDSNASQYRNPINDDDDNGTIVQATATGGANGSQKEIIPDDLPSWVDVTFKFSDPRKQEKETTYHETIQLASSLETYVPDAGNTTDGKKPTFSGKSVSR